MQLQHWSGVQVYDDGAPVARGADKGDAEGANNGVPKGAANGVSDGDAKGVATIAISIRPLFVRSNKKLK